MSRLTWSTAGESHGPGLVAIAEGLPAGLPLTTELINRDLARRQRGYGRGGRMKIERDQVRFVGGVRGGETLGGPVAMTIENLDHAKWTQRMQAAPFTERPERVTRPRPGHADLAGGMKYDRRDLRDVLERASARETAARVLVGAACRELLRCVAGIRVLSHVVQIGPIESPIPQGDVDWDATFEAAELSDVGCADPATSERMREHIHATAKAGDTLGGVFEVVALGVPTGLGSHVRWDRRLDGRLAQALMSIPAIKGVEVGLGFEAARRPGSEVHDAIRYDASRLGFARSSNRAGGLEGGITNGEPVRCRAAMKPISTLRKPLESVDIDDKQPFEAAVERSDVCAVPAAAVVGEAMVAITLGDALLEKCGGDSLGELKRNYERYLEQIRDY